jgi:ribosomal protein L40E
MPPAAINQFPHSSAFFYELHLCMDKYAVAAWCVEKCRPKWKTVNLRRKAPHAILMLSQDIRKI